MRVGTRHAKTWVLRLLRSCARGITLLPAGLISRGTQMALDAALSALSLWLAYLLRFDAAIPLQHRTVLWALILLVPFVRPLIMLALGAYDAIWRYFNLRDTLVLALSALPCSLLLLALRYSLHLRLALVPAGVIVIDYILFLALACSLRALRRLTYEVSRPAAQRPCRALLVGTESTLPQAIRHLATSPELELVGVLAPEDQLQGLRIGGFLVMERPSALARLLVSQRIDLVLIADSRPQWIAETVATATQFGADVRLLPSAANLVRGDVRVFANPAPEMAFTRPGVDTEAVTRFSPPDPRVIGSFRDRVVLITGAGGSIGSELARQVAHLPVSGLVLLDRDENSVFELSNALAVLALEAPHAPRVTPCVGDIRDAALMRAIFDRHRPQAVLHAAAYKHVPIMEANPCEAVLNNIAGTRIAARAAIAAGAERFVMISSDKAVHPSSVMGATKRLAEMLIWEEARAQQTVPKPSPTRMACVRFGNVVGSRGSVVPIFLRQIAAGGPITITDEHMTRYFMTIPEAAQLVLQAASLTSAAGIYMLDMGDPVKVTALARRLIELSGLKPGADIEICFIGSRPGEKITEELWHADSEIVPTPFPRVLAVNAPPPPADFSASLMALEAAALERNDAAVLEALRSMPIGFAPRELPQPQAKSRSAFVN